MTSGSRFSRFWLLVAAAFTPPIPTSSFTGACIFQDECLRPPHVEEESIWTGLQLASYGIPDCQKRDAISAVHGREFDCASQLARALREVTSEPADTDLPLGHRMVRIQDN